MRRTTRTTPLRLATLVLTALPFTTLSVRAADNPTTQGLRLMAQRAVSADTAEARDAIGKLREAGRSGVVALEMAHESELRSAYSFPQRKQTAEWKRLCLAFEKVGAQRDNWASRLYWFTDLEQAKAQALKENKPILSLRLLGHLDDELSCANSRFLRTALYPDVRVRMFLQSHYILHWQSVRSVPKVTIDFGDGRKIETTITGNSIHYVLDSEGRVLDALPGLYGPGAFYRWIERTRHVAQESGKHEGAAREEYLRRFHTDQLEQITRAWQTDVGRLQIPVTALPTAEGTASIKRTSAAPPGTPPGSEEILISVPATAPTARTAGAVPVTKQLAEIRSLERITVSVPRDRDALTRKTEDALWERIAALHAPDAKLDNYSLEVLKSKTSRAATVTATFEKSIAEDTVRNEYLRHTTIHQWLMQNPNFDLDQLNRRVYNEMFLTPDSDPWLGLLPIDAYTAIPNDGVIAN